MYHDKFNSMFQPLMMCGWATGLAILSPVADNTGRRKPFLRMTAIQIMTIITLMVFTMSVDPSKSETNIYILGVLLFMIGLSRSSGLIGLLMMVENVPRIYTVLMCTLFNSVEVVSTVVWVVFFSIIH